LRRYLAEFLSDPRVVEIPRFLWLMILHGIILRVRPAKSAHKYASIWTEHGSPLKVWTDLQSQALQQRFDPQLIQVRYAMRYGSPAVGHVLDELKLQGVNRVLILPAYPQYSATTTASARAVASETITTSDCSATAAADDNTVPPAFLRRRKAAGFGSKPLTW
jgi:ferrochelatase